MEIRYLAKSKEELEKLEGAVRHLHVAVSPSQTLRVQYLPFLYEDGTIEVVPLGSPIQKLERSAMEFMGFDGENSHIFLINKKENIRYRIHLRPLKESS